MKKVRCALCGRLTLSPAVWIGQEPIGPKCARRAGLLNLPKRPGTRVVAGTRRQASRDPVTLDLFAGMDP